MIQHNCDSVLKLAEDGELVGTLKLDNLAAVNLYTAATVIFKAAKENLIRRHEEGLFTNRC